MITISTPWTEEHGDLIYIKAKVKIDANDAEKYVQYCQLKENRREVKYIDDNYIKDILAYEELWFSVNKKYEHGICSDRADAFLVSILHYAMVSNADIYVDAPVTSELVYKIRNEIIPHLCRGKFKKIKIDVRNVIEPYRIREKCAATAMSCGIDSFFTVFLNQYNDTLNEYKIKYFTFFNVGAVNSVFKDNISITRRNELMELVSKKKKSQAQEVANRIGEIELVYISSNISDFYRGMIVNSAHYRNFGAAMIMQGLWSSYYYSSGGLDIEDIRYDLCDDPAYYEEMLCYWLSNGNINFYATGHAFDRFEKTKALVDYDICREFLTVCDNDENCGQCSKCKRTISTLLSLNDLKYFSGRFDIDKITRKLTYWKIYIISKKKERFFERIYKESLENGFINYLEVIVFSPICFVINMIRKCRIYQIIKYKRFKEKHTLD